MLRDLLPAAPLFVYALLLPFAAHEALAGSSHGPNTTTLEAIPTLSAPPCQCVDCDLDHNERLGLADWQLLFAAFGKTTKQDGYSPRADFNRDGVVNGADWQTATTCCPPPVTGQ